METEERRMVGPKLNCQHSFQKFALPQTMKGVRQAPCPAALYVKVLRRVCGLRQQPNEYTAIVAERIDS